METKNNINLNNFQGSKNILPNNSPKTTPKNSNNDPTNSLSKKNINSQSPTKKLLLKSRRHSVNVGMIEILTDKIRKPEKENFSINPIREVNKKKTAIQKKKAISEEIKEVPIPTVISLIQKESSKRIINDVLSIKTFLDKTEIYQKLSEDFENNFLQEDILEKIFFKVAKQLKYYYLPKGDVLFRINEDPSNFYFILSGKVNIMKLCQDTILLTGFEYFQYLYRLYNKNDLYLIEVIIDKNKDIFPISKYELNEMNLIVFSILIDEYLSEGSFFSISSVCEKCFIDLTKYSNIELDKLNNSQKLDDILFRNKKEIFEKIPKYNANIKKNFKPFITIKNKIPVKIFKYYNFLQRGVYGSLGDFALDKNMKQNSTIIAEEPTELCYLTKSEYTYLLKQENKKLKLKEAIFLKDNFIFKRINKKFESIYFDHFIYEECKDGHELFTQNEPVEYIYFLKEGTIELNIYMNTRELFNLINILQQLKKGLKFYELENTDLQSPRKNKDIIDEKKNIKILLMQKIDCVGLESFFYEMNYIYSAKTVSRTVQLYKIRKDDLTTIILSERSTNNFLQAEAKRKIESLLYRLNNLKEVKEYLTKRKNSENSPQHQNTSINHNNHVLNRNNKDHLKLTENKKKLFNTTSYNDNKSNNKKNISKSNYSYKKLQMQLNLYYIKNNINRNDDDDDFKKTFFPKNNFILKSSMNQKLMSQLIMNRNLNSNKFDKINYNSIKKNSHKKIKVKLTSSQNLKNLSNNNLLMKKGNNKTLPSIVKKHNHKTIEDTEKMKQLYNIPNNLRSSSLKYETNLLKKLEKELQIDSVIRLIAPPNQNYFNDKTKNKSYNIDNNIQPLTQNKENTPKKNDNDSKIVTNYNSKETFTSKCLAAKSGVNFFMNKKLAETSSLNFRDRNYKNNLMNTFTSTYTSNKSTSILK